MFESYDAAYAVVESYDADLSCSDDREYYRIMDTAEEPGIDDSWRTPCVHFWDDDYRC